MTDQIRHVRLSDLRIAAANTRKDTEAGQEDAGIEGLAQSIREHGLLNPLTVRYLTDGTYEIIAGQRRYLACRHLGFANIPVIVREDLTEGRAIALSLIENVQRADMHPLDKARAYSQLRDQYEGNLRSVAQATGVTVPTIQRYLDILRLPLSLQEELGTDKGAAGIGALSAIARSFSDDEDMVEAYNKIGGFTQDIQREILKHADGDVGTLPELVQHALEGAFNARACGSGLQDCPHVPEELRPALLEAAEALSQSRVDSTASLREFAGRHKKRPR